MTDQASVLVQVAIFAAVAFRGIQIGRGLTGRNYRKRAFWVSGLAGTILLAIAFGQVPALGGVNILDIPVRWLLSYPVEYVVAFAFVDSTILASLELDFFHRDTLHWRKLRLLGYAAVVGEASQSIVLSYFVVGPNPPSWAVSFANSAFATTQNAVGYFLPFIFSGITLLVATNRTADSVLRRYMKMLGIVVLMGIVNYLNNDYVGNNLIGDVTGVLAAFFLYFATMRLSPISKVEVAEATGSASASGMHGDPQAGKS